MNPAHGRKERFPRRETRRRGALLLLALSLGPFAPVSAAGSSSPSGLGSVGGAEVTLSYGYQFGGGFDIDAGKLEVEPAANLAITFGYANPARPTLHGEFAYSRQRARVNLRESVVGSPEYLFDVDMHYFLLGAMYDFPLSKRAVPFAGISLGAATANPVGNRYDTETFFAFSLAGGMKAYLSERYGIRGQARLLAPVEFTSGSLFCTSPGGCAISVSGGTVIWQGDVSAGVFVHF